MTSLTHGDLQLHGDPLHPTPFDLMKVVLLPDETLKEKDDSKIDSTYHIFHLLLPLLLLQYIYITFCRLGSFTLTPTITHTLHTTHTPHHTTIP
jgi:hypothetical protein